MLQQQLQNAYSLLTKFKFKESEGLWDGKHYVLLVFLFKLLVGLSCLVEINVKFLALFQSLTTEQFERS